MNLKASSFDLTIIPLPCVTSTIFISSSKITALRMVSGDTLYCLANILNIYLIFIAYNFKTAYILPNFDLNHIKLCPSVVILTHRVKEGFYYVYS
jgi:hypothetical protein